MAALVLRLVLLGVLAAAAADDVPVEWSGGHSWLMCSLPEAGRFAPRPPPPPLAADDTYRPFTWTYEGHAVPPQRVAANGSLEVARGRDGQGHYQCAANHHGGRVLGYPKLLKFATIGDKFSQNPEDTTVRAGLPTVFRCDIASEPPAEVVWLKDHRPILDDDRHYNLQNQLLILGVTNNDAGYYSCIARNPVLDEERRSPGGRLTVAPPAEGLAPSPLDLQVDEAPTVPHGGRVLLACPVVAGTSLEMMWQFTPPGGLTAEMAGTDPVLVMSSVGAEDVGVYTCKIAGQDSVIRQFNLTVSEPPMVVIPPASKEAPRASTVRFNCTAVGSPQPDITWYKDGQELEFTVRARVIKSYDEDKRSGDRMELVISGITSDDAGIYQCFASNKVGVVSSWAELNVTGTSAAAPTAVTCRPVGPRSVFLRWTQPDHGTIVAYTIHVTPQVPDGQPILWTNATVRVPEPFTVYGFQVRAFIKNNARSSASDYSDTVSCSGQGAPIHLSKLPTGRVLVSWQQAAATRGVLEWQLQLRPESHARAERRITLPPGTHNYTLDVSSGHYAVRVLGTKTLPWLKQDLSRLPWSSTAQARDHFNGDSFVTPSELVVSNVTTSSFTVTWHCDEADATFAVCLKRSAPGEQYSCHERSQNSYTAEDLEGDTQYSVKIQAHSGPFTGPFTAPLVIRTLKPEPSLFANVRPVYVNGTTAVLRWGGPADAQYTVRLLSELSLPIEVWRAMVVTGPEVYIPLNPVNNTYVMVSTMEAEVVNSHVFTIYSQDSKEVAKELLNNRSHDIDPTDVQDINHEYTSDGLMVRWSGPAGARYRVRFSQDLLIEMEAWSGEYVNKPQILLKGVDTSLPTYLQVRLVRPDGPRLRVEAPVYTLPPAPSAPSSLYLGIGVGVGVCLLCLLLVAAFCIWKRRKRYQSPSRAGRRNLSTQESNEEEGSEMTTVGGRLANGGAQRGADEPLLNGHVHIIENPTVTKSPNGKTKKPRISDPAVFDLSRFEEANTTAETTLEADISAPYEYLDTSRQPDSSRSCIVNPNSENVFGKLPDDNMNSELTRSTDYIQKDNSKVQPTLQPNG